MIKNSTASQILRVLTPILLSCFCVVMTALFSECVQHHLKFYWALSLLLWGTILIISSVAPTYINPHMPLLIVWAVWISLQSDFQIASSTDYAALFKESRLWNHSFLMVFALLSTIIRNRLYVLVLSVLEVFYLAVIPKSGEIDVTLMIVQSILFCILYFLSLLVSLVVTRKRSEPLNTLSIVMGSVWVLWIDHTLQLAISALAYLAVCLLVFASYYESIAHLWSDYNRAHIAPTEESPPEKTE